MHVQECIKNLPIYQVDQKNGLFLILTNYKVKYKRVLANIGVIVPLRKKLAERIDKAKANKSRIRLYDYLLSIDTESQGKADSIKLSDLTQFLAVSPNNPDFAEDASIVAANFKDLDKFNPNKLAELLRSFSELYYKEVQDVPANELYKSAIHALLFKTIDKAIQEDQQSGKSLNETIARLNEIIDKVEPKGIDKEKSLLKGFSDYVAPSNKRIQDIMSSFLYPRSDEKKQETKEEKETRLAAEKKADKERQKIQDKLTRYNTEKEEKRNNRNEKERIEKEKQKQHYASVEQSKQKKALSQGKHKQASLLDQERIKQFSSAKQKEHDIKSALEKEKNPPKLEALKLQLTQATLEVSQAKGILPTFYVDYINAKEEERKALLELEKAREDTRKAEQEYDSIKRRVERNKDELNRLGEHKAPQEVGGLLSKFSEYEVVLELRKLCNGRLKIGKGDIDAQKDRLKSRKIALVHQLEILNRREDDPDRIKAIEKIQNENNLQGTQQNDQKLKDYISDTKLKLELNLAMVRSHLHMLSVDDGSLLEHKLSEDVGEILMVTFI